MPTFLPNTEQPNDKSIAFQLDGAEVFLLPVFREGHVRFFATSLKAQMAHDTAIQPESFEEILAWLNADREVAGTMYVQLRQDLGKIFIWNRCSDPDGLTDEVFDRVAKKVHDIRPTYAGDPRLYFRGVARNLVKEHFKKIRTQVSFEALDPLQQQITEDEKEKVHRIREECIDELSPTERQLLFSYYQAKKRDARRLAADLDMSEGNLRVRISRIRRNLRKNFQRKMQST